MFRQALEGVLGVRLAGGELIPPADPGPAAELGTVRVWRDLTGSPLRDAADWRRPVPRISPEAELSVRAHSVQASANR
jgi:hypothetical protein